MHKPTGLFWPKSKGSQWVLLDATLWLGNSTEGLQSVDTDATSYGPSIGNFPFEEVIRLSD